MLFEGLAIEQKPHPSPKPVIRIDFSSVITEQGIRVFRRSVERKLREIADCYAIDFPPDLIVEEYFDLLITRLYKATQERVVILIDEYDKPLVDNLGNSADKATFSKFLRSFFGTLKSQGTKIQFILFTGITKLANLSIFSVLNHVEDISLNPTYGSLLGITEEEIKRYFSEYIQAFGIKNEMAQEEVFTLIREWYNGYSWDGVQKVYNPFALLLFMKNLEVQSYWYETGTPNLLVEQIKKRKIAIPTLEQVEIETSHLLKGSLDTLSLPHLLFQTGYLTIKHKQTDTIPPIYTLGYPNKEVRMAFLEHLFHFIADSQSHTLSPNIKNLKVALQNENFEQFLEIIRGVIAQISYNLHIPKESYYHSLFYIILGMMGLKMHPEVMTSRGRIDGVIELQNKVFIFEFKYGQKGADLGKLAQKAIKQIFDKGYLNRYKGISSKLFVIGIGFHEKEIVGIIKRYQH